MSTPTEQYSTLEAVLPGALPHQNDRPFPSDPQKQVVVVFEKEIGASNEGIEVVKGPRVVVHEDDFTESQQTPPSQSSRRKRILWPVAIVGALIVISIVGGILGSRHSLSVPAGEAKTNTTQKNLSAPIRGGLAAVSYTANIVNETRVYYQDTLGQVMEATGSAGNASWNTRGLGFSARRNSSIAAAVTRPDLSPLQISIVYMDNDFILHDRIYNDSTNAWNEGTLAAAQYRSLPNSSLSAMYHQCSLCSNNTLVSYQDKNGSIQIANLTESGWISTKVIARAAPNTALALHPFYRAGVEDQINLYYQSALLNVTLAYWIPATLNPVNGLPSWLPALQTLSPIAPGAPIVAAASYSTVSPVGLPTWIELLSPTESGFKVDTWSGNINNWLQYDLYPPTMTTLSGQRAFGAAAVTAIGTAFSIVGKHGEKDTIEVWQVADDMVDWTPAGNIDVGDAWD